MSRSARWPVQWHTADAQGSIQLFKKLGVKMTPELKTPSVAMPFDTNGDGNGDLLCELHGP